MKRLLHLLAIASTCLGTAALATGPVRVVATTSIVGDIVTQVGGDVVNVQSLIPAGVDPHAFEPTPRDAVLVAGADLVVANGAGLEPSLDRLLRQSGSKATFVDLSVELPLRHLDGESECSGHHDEDHEHHHHGDMDPHVWFDPVLVTSWTRTIEQALAGLVPGETDALHARAEAYRAKLETLDAWIRTEVEKIPADRRMLVTDHNTFGYFAARYDFDVVGAVMPGFSSAAEPSAQDLAKLHDAIPAKGVRAIFIGSNVSPELAARVAKDAGIRIVALATCTLRPAGEPSSDYLSFMSNNVAAIVGALAGDAP